MNPYSPPGALPNTYPVGPPPHVAGAVGVVTEAAVQLLQQTRPWVMLLSVLAFVGSGLMIVVGLLAGGFALLMPGKGATAALGLVYIPLALVYIYPGIKLWGYGAAIARLTASHSTVDLEDALGQQKSFWRFSGIASVVVMVLYAVAIAGVIAVGAVAAGLGKLGQ